MNPHNSFTFFTEKETAEAFQYLIPDINNIIYSYLEGLPEWCFLGNKILLCSYPEEITTTIKEIGIQTIPFSENYTSWYIVQDLFYWRYYIPEIRNCTLEDDGCNRI
jgi:hypothetical protein